MLKAVASLSLGPNNCKSVAASASITFHTNTANNKLPQEGYSYILLVSTMPAARPRASFEPVPPRARGMVLTIEFQTAGGDHGVTTSSPVFQDSTPACRFFRRLDLRERRQLCLDLSRKATPMPIC
ncbi:hypothetical protein ACET3X_002543 [Alternaria dauci]|uniref:Uncharacterized protein n=1 Tax=Alternaria dauci TaxID=48095 RepID=A0ABR3UPV3_9PLEO